VPAILERLDPDVEWEHEGVDHGVPWLSPGRGCDHVARFFGGLQALDVRRFEPVALLVGGTQVAVPVRFGATVKATGRTLDDLEIHLWTFGGSGRVAPFGHVLDTHQHVVAREPGRA